MMKKLISIIVAMALSQAAFVRPLYAAESEPETTTEITTVSSEVVATEAITHPQAVILVPDYGTTAVDSDTDGEPPNDEGIWQTPGGAGTLLEDVSQCEVNRQFITVRSRGGNIFYIIIDNDRSSENVYFLSAVNDWDLISFSENFPDGVWEAYEEIKEEAANNAIAAEIAANAGEESGGGKTAESPETPTGGGNTSTIILVVIGIGFAGGFAYFKFFRGKKKQAAMPNYDHDEEEEDDSEIDENEEDN
jgi:hypothetical protein